MGRPCILTVDQQNTIIEWYRQKKALGSAKEVATRLGINIHAVGNIVVKWKKRQKRLQQRLNSRTIETIR